MNDFPQCQGKQMLIHDANFNFCPVVFFCQSQGRVEVGLGNIQFLPFFKKHFFTMQTALVAYSIAEAAPTTTKVTRGLSYDGVDFTMVRLRHGDLSCMS